MLVNVGKAHDNQLAKQLKEFEKITKELKAYLDKHNIDIPITCRQRYDVESDKDCQI